MVTQKNAVWWGSFRQESPKEGQDTFLLKLRGSSPLSHSVTVNKLLKAFWNSSVKGSLKISQKKKQEA